MKTAYLTGDTYMIRQALGNGGWDWEPDTKRWAKACDDDDDEKWITSRVRALAGVRNRGTFTVTIED